MKLLQIMQYPAMNGTGHAPCRVPDTVGRARHGCGPRTTMKDIRDRSYLDHEESRCLWVDCRTHVRHLPPISELPTRIIGLLCPFCEGTDFRQTENPALAGCAECGAELEPEYCRDVIKLHTAGPPATARQAVDMLRTVNASEQKAHEVVEAILSSSSAVARLLLAMEKIKLGNVPVNNGGRR